MITKKLDEVKSFVANDLTVLKEILHPSNDQLDLPYSIAHAYIEKGNASLPHTLNNTEVYLILSGKGSIHVEEKVVEVQAGSMVVVPPGALQFVRNTGEEQLAFYCIVSPAWSGEEEEVL